MSQDPEDQKLAMPQLARFPNPIPTTLEGNIFGLPPRDQTCQEALSQEIAEELDTKTEGEKPLPIFNR